MESSRSSVRADPDLEVWPKDIFGVEPPGADIAHLIPHSPVHASAYFDVARCAFGFDHTANWRTLQKAIHGSRLRSDSTLQRNTGIKHRVPNKIRLSHQARFFDVRPCVLVVPIMDLDAAKAWSGGGYDAIVMVEKWGLEERSTLAPVRSETVRLRIGMTTPAVRTARPQEIEVARTLLTHFLRGLAHSLAHRTKNRELVPERAVRKLCKKGRKTLLRSAGTALLFQWQAQLLRRTCGCTVCISLTPSAPTTEMPTRPRTHSCWLYGLPSPGQHGTTNSC
jgi:hypothetical protein